MLFNKGLPAERLQRGTEEEEFWRVVHIIAGIVADSGHEELAVNIPNDDFIEALPRNQIVEVPAVIDRNGTKGIRLDSYPRVFSGLLQSEEPLHDRLTETIHIVPSRSPDFSAPPINSGTRPFFLSSNPS